MLQNYPFLQDTPQVTPSNTAWLTKADSIWRSMVKHEKISQDEIGAAFCSRNRIGTSYLDTETAQGWSISRFPLTFRWVPIRCLSFNDINLLEFSMNFEIIGEIENVEVIAVGGNIRDVMRLRKQYGIGRWRKLKGIALIRLKNDRIRKAELHWYEAHGIGRKKIKIKRFLDKKWQQKMKKQAMCSA